MIALSRGGQLLRITCVGVIFAMLLQLFLTPVTYALADDVTLTSQDFASYSGVDAEAPTDWMFTNIGAYTSTASSGQAPNSLQFNSSDSVATVSYNLKSGQTSKALTFWMKGNSIGTSGSTFTVKQSADSGSWATISSYTGAAIPSAGTTFTVDLLPATTSVQFSYTKVSGNLALDDVMIIGKKLGDSTPPSVPTASVPSGAYNTAQTVTLNSDDDSGAATIRYTIDNTVPSQASQRYTAPIMIAANTTLRAIAYDGDGNASGEATFSYVIDAEAPTIEKIEYSNNGTPTNNNVTVTATTSEPVNTPDGWTKVDSTTFTKEYSTNTTDSLIVKDAAGNISDASAIAVEAIDKVSPTITIGGTDVDGVYNGSTNYTVADDVAIQSVTINGIEAPQTGTITRTGAYTISVVDTAGNSTSQQIYVLIPVVVAPAVIVATSVPKPISPIRITPTVPVTPANPSRAVDTTKDVKTSVGDSIDASPQVEQAAVATSSQGWKLWGVAWYWYLLVTTLVAVVLWQVYATWHARREADEDLEL
ncbi:MAG TPA: chitobiase/beta-hexosaminidase C-terminal domain-containing protein [Candidatus Saccharimonadales bacterium]